MRYIHTPPDLSSKETFRRHTLAQIAFILVSVQLVILTQPWWLPSVAQTSIGKELFSIDHLPLPNATPLIIQVQEITQHPTQPAYWNIKIDMHNQAEAWVSYPHLVLSFLDSQKNVSLRQVWSPQEYAPLIETKALSPNEKKHLNLWLKLPKHIPSEYNLDYFYPS